MKAVILPESKAISISSLPIMEMFDTLQGEGFHTGKAAFFIRTGGCDVGCHWCDVKESWDADNHATMDYDQILSKIDPESGDEFDPEFEPELSQNL